MCRYVLTLLLTFCTSVLAADFRLADIPKGKEITLPNPATTIVAAYDTFFVAATDNGQTLKLSLEGGRRNDKIRLGIYDKNQESVIYFNLTRMSPVVYSFKGMDKIRIVPKTRGRLSSKIKVESNRPLTIGR